MSKSCKLSQLIADYLAINKRIVQSTADLNQRAFNELIDLAGNVEADKVSEDDAELFQAYLIEKGLSKTSANILVSSINPVFNWAVRKGIIKKNPFAILKKFKIARRPITVFEMDEIKRLLECSDNLWKARILLGLSTLRRGEVLNLTIRNIDFENMIIRIVPKDKTAFTWPWQPKDCECRIVPLITPLVNVLLRIIEKLPEGHPYICLTPQRYQFLMGKSSLKYRWRSNPDNNFERNFRLICKNAMISGKVFHDLRKTGLTLLTGGLRLQEVRDIGGHSSIETTEKYLANRKDCLSRARELISDSVNAV